ncbi:DUF262 domain-containing HNH endonuclease family protein [Pseudomonas sp. LjRoot71]|uniref:DUF262 domain-containing protein n=1 Tax=Pseudomonas sp. LjRoot71 TaxID=3342336 RepID=UPI003ECD9017
MKIESKLYSLAQIVAESPNWHFNIPIYQRLYVWGEDQVLTLLNDLLNAYEQKNDLFFLGGTLLVEQEDGVGRHFDLIDGQQRFTTLWLLCSAWQQSLEPFLTVTSGEHTEPRLGFAIRPAVNSFMQGLAFKRAGAGDDDVESTQRMRIALRLMQSIFAKRELPAGMTDRDAYLKGLTAFVFRQVKFVITTVPRETDLNKLFEVINNRGVQLQHHEILKARMLDALTEDERLPYAVLWEACADMDSFIERSLSGISGIPANEVCALYELGDLAKASSVRRLLHSKLQQQGDHHALALEEILRPADNLDSADGDASDEDVPPSWVRSIFGFPLLLQHTLRIWLLEKNLPDLPRLLDRELLALFESHFFNDAPERAENVKSFIDLLWRVRVIFDEHIIKWVDQGEDEVHLISALSVSTSSGKSGKRYMNRSRETDAHRPFSLLQSMLYHSQEITTQYWLTPLLLFIHRSTDMPDQDNRGLYFDYLRHLDNHLLGSVASDSLVARTRAFMEQPWLRRELNHRAALAQSDGVNFAHYWFYKLEFVLWFQAKRETEGWKKFRLTAKNSVEHISPQTPKDSDDNRVEKSLDCFGNLALVSRSVNSEYGNLPYNEKRQRFHNNNKKKIDSLKMDLIYQGDKWNDTIAFEHQKAMIECLDDYCVGTSKLMSK